jgi:alpha-galactosidase
MSSIGFDKQKGLEAHAGPGHWNDPDMLEIGNGGMSDDEYRTHMSLWAMLAAPLIAGNDLRSMTPSVRDILTDAEVIAIDQDALGRQGKQALKNADTEIWVRPLERDALAVALFNRGAQRARIFARWSDLGITGNYAIRSVWDKASRGATATEYTTEVGPHAVALLKLEPAPEKPKPTKKRRYNRGT